MRYGFMGITLVAAAGAATLLALGTAPSAHAGPLRHDWIAPEARVVVHVDFEALEASSLSDLVDEPPSIPIAQIEGALSEMEAMEAQYEVDFEDDMLSLTYCAHDGDVDRGVIICVMNERYADVMAGLREEMPDRVKDVSFGPHAGMVWDTGEDEAMLVHMRPHGTGGMYVMAESEATMLAALDRIDGNAEGGAKNIKVAPREGSIVHATIADVSDFAEIDPSSKIIKMSEGLILDIGEHDELVFARIELTTGDSKEARILSGLLQGLLAIGMAIGDEPEFEEFNEVVSAIDISASDDRITLQIQVPAEEID